MFLQTVVFILLKTLAHASYLRKSCNNTELPRRPEASYCFVSTQNFCTNVYNVDELMKFNDNIPPITFTPNSLVILAQRNSVCAKGFSVKRNLSKWDISEIRGWTVEVLVEKGSEELGRNVIHYLLDRSIKLNKANLDEVFFCFTTGISTAILDLAQDSGVFVWISLKTLPPAWRSEPIDYPGSPIRLSDLDHALVEADACELLSVKIIERSRNRILYVEESVDEAKNVDGSKNQIKDTGTKLIWSQILAIPCCAATAVSAVVLTFIIVRCRSRNKLLRSKNKKLEEISMIRKPEELPQELLMSSRSYNHRDIRKEIKDGPHI